MKSMTPMAIIAPIMLMMKNFLAEKRISRIAPMKVPVVLAMK